MELDEIILFVVVVGIAVMTCIAFSEIFER